MISPIVSKKNEMNIEEKYKNYSNKQLIEIIANAVDYQVEAVNAAKIVLSERNVSKEEKEQVLESIELENKVKEEKEFEKVDKLRKLTSSIFNKLNPLNQEEFTSSQLVKIVVWIFSIIYLVKMYFDFPLFVSLFTDPPSKFELEVLFFLIGVFYLPLALLYFNKYKVIGWSLMTIYTSFSLIGNVGSILFSWLLGSGSFSVIDFNLSINYLMLIIFTLLYLGTLIILLKPSVIKQFTINKRTKIYSIFIGVVGFIVYLSYWIS